MKNIIATVAVAALLTGCATSPSSVAPTYVSPVVYQNFSCQQLADEAQRVSSRAAQAAGVQREKAARDTVAMTAAIVVFWPALFLVGGDQGNAAELANLRGQMQAIEEASRAKGCNIQFSRG
jgi:hypothetical protein